MARVKDNLLIKGTGGAIGKEIVYRTIKNKTFSGKYPDMSGIIPSKKQTKGRERFAEAVKFAKSVMKDPEKIAEYKSRPGFSVYHAAIQEYLSWSGRDKPIPLSLPESQKTALQSLSLTERQFRAVAYLNEHKKITNNIYRKLNQVSKATATRHLHELADKGVMQSNGGKGAGAHYIMGSVLIRK